MNHNWLNAANVRFSWAKLVRQRAHICKFVADCARDEDMVQDLLSLQVQRCALYVVRCVCLRMLHL